MGSLDVEIFQRLMLSNQYDILARLELESADRYRDLAEQIRSWWPLESLEPVSWLGEARRDPLTAKDQGFVLDVLELFDALQRADREGKVGKDDRDAVAFPGFCGNYETRYLSFLEWLRDHRRFTYVELANPADPNSHMPMLGLYERMLDRWDSLGRPRTLSAADAAAILGERHLARLALGSESEPVWIATAEPG